MKKQFLFVILTLVIVASCKKHKTSPPAPVCKISQLSGATLSNTIKIAYDDNFRISTIAEGDRLKSFSYSGNTITVLETIGGIFERRYIHTIDNAGNIVNSREEENKTGTIWNNTAFTYSGNQITTATSTRSSSTISSVSNFVWSNGNLVTITDATGTIENAFEYYTDKAYQDADYLNLQFLTSNGVNPIRNKNLLKTYTGSGSTISYEFDASGKIVKLLANGSPVIDVQHLCK